MISGRPLLFIYFIDSTVYLLASQVVIVVKNTSTNARDIRDMLQSLDWEDTLEEGKATHSNIFAWRIPWTKEPGRLWSIGWQELDMTETI